MSVVRELKVVIVSVSALIVSGERQHNCKGNKYTVNQSDCNCEVLDEYEGRGNIRPFHDTKIIELSNYY